MLNEVGDTVGGKLAIFAFGHDTSPVLFICRSEGLNLSLAMSDSDHDAESCDWEAVAEGIAGKLTEDDIPEASLSEPLETHTIPELKWWLLCRGVQLPTSWKKAQIISRIREAKSEGLDIVDVDGSYVYRKYQQMVSNGIAVSDPGPSTVPLTGWEQVLERNYKDMAKKIPKVTHGLLYTYLAEGVGSTNVSGAFWALKRGFNHWASGSTDHLYVHYAHPSYCHMKCDMIPSMKTGTYRVYVLLVKSGDLANRIEKATCDCVAGLLHALVSICIEEFKLSNGTTGQSDAADEEPNLPMEGSMKKEGKRNENVGGIF